MYRPLFSHLFPSLDVDGQPATTTVYEYAVNAWGRPTGIIRSVTTQSGGLTHRRWLSHKTFADDWLKARASRGD